jgi:hypothetical protein
VVIVGMVLAALAGAFLWRRQHLSLPPSAKVAVAPVARPPPPPASLPRAETPAVPARPAHPVAPAAPPRGPLPALDDADSYLERALSDLIGRKLVSAFLATDGFARRFVATVNNLATDNAAAELWPVDRTPGKFVAETRPGVVGAFIGARNDDRYAPFVRFVEGIDTQRAVELYARLYPLFQRAYEDLGFPGRYFNDRVIEVIDNLLATPRSAAVVPVKRAEVEGASPSEKSGALYLFADPALEARSAGRKILLRIGPEHAARLEAKLADVRRRITEQPMSRTLNKP